MIHYDVNVDIVIEKLHEFGYSSTNIKFNKSCYSKFKSFQKEKGAAFFSFADALDWCNQFYKKKHRVRAGRAMERLNDVYEYGFVLNRHLMVHGVLSPCFEKALQQYMDSIQAEGFVKSSYYRIGEGCRLFCRYLQINQVYDIDKIGYPVLEKFHEFLIDCEGSYFDYENYAARLLKAWAEQGLCRIGYSLYLHYAKFEKISSLDDLSYENQNLIQNYNNEGVLSINEYYQMIPDFIECLVSHGYSDNTVRVAKKHLYVLCLFLDRADLCYERHIADLWLKDVGERVFGIDSAANCSRTLDLFDDFMRDKNICPSIVGRHVMKPFDYLPNWCKAGINQFITDWERANPGDCSNRHRISVYTKFCGFLHMEGLTAFSQITPDTIKKFNLYDIHDDAHSKNTYNSYIRYFLLYLEMNNVIPDGLHFALPCTFAKKERIVCVLSPEDRKIINAYCEKAASPLELRDAAILRIAMDTALRACDIAGLQKSNINWKGKYIKLIQHKTGVEHIHPVKIRTLNAIYRYIKQGRPHLSSNYIFITSQAPYKPVGKQVCRRALIHAGAKETRFHVLRKTYATDVLKSGASFSETAELLGHSSTHTVHRYTALDEEHMHLCPLSLEETGLFVNGRCYCER